MKVYIGKYVTYYSFYLDIEDLEFVKKYPFINNLAEKWNDFVHKHNSIVNGINRVLNFSLEPIRYVKMDDYDTWNLDWTLSQIILPALVQLKKQKHGGPNVDDDDVPDELKSIAAKPKENEHDIDEYWFNRWDYVLDEMIFAFEKISDSDWESKFFNDVNFTFEPIDSEHELNSPKKFYELKMDDNLKFDKDGYDLINNRISNGLRLFGKYYRALWT